MKYFITRAIAAFAVALTWLEVILAASDTNGKNSFRALGSLRMTPAFADLRALTSAANCSDWQSQVINGADMSCDLYGRTGDLGYPPFSVASFAALGITEGLSAGLAIAIATIFLVLTWWIFLSKSNGSILAAIMLTITVIGTPTALALERMNIDVLIFILLIGISLLAESSATRSSRKAIQAIVGFLIFSLSTVLVAWKIYPAFGLASIAVIKNPQTTGIRRYVWVSLVIGTIFGIGSVIPWMLQGERIPSPGLGLISHGLIGKEPIEKIGTSLVIGLSIWLIPRSKNLATIILRDCKATAANITTIPSAYLACTAIWVLSFLVTRSYDYRMIFLYPAIAYISKIGGLSRRLWSMRAVALALFGILLLAPIPYFLLDSTNLGITDLMQLSSSKSVLAFLKLSSWWIGRIMDLGGTALMGVLVIIVLLGGAQEHKTERSELYVNEHCT